MRIYVELYGFYLLIFTFGVSVTIYSGASGKECKTMEEFIFFDPPQM